MVDLQVVAFFREEGNLPALRAATKKRQRQTKMWLEPYCVRFHGERLCCVKSLCEVILLFFELHPF